MKQSRNLMFEKGRFITSKLHPGTACLLEFLQFAEMEQFY